MRPSILCIEQVPPALRDLPQWVFWRWVERDGKRVKVPIGSMGYPAAVNKPATWSKLDFLLSILARNPHFAAGLGFVLTSRDPFTGIDLDDVLTDSGSVKLWAEALLKQFGNTYIEVTPSGSGLRVWCLATTARALKKELPDGAIENYSVARYFTFYRPSLQRRAARDHRSPGRHRSAAQLLRPHRVFSIQPHRGKDRTGRQVPYLLFARRHAD
jgi:primase-polymerase (primpol)-like protein